MLIITYYWPPSGGSSVLRWLKFARYLHEFGWIPTIYTPSNPEPQAYDPALLKEVPATVKVVTEKIREPYRIFKLLTGRKRDETLTTSFVSEKKKGCMYEFLIWIRGNFFIPDARILWVRPSIYFLSRFLETDPHDVIVSTGPPHSMHLIGLGLKEKLNIPWVADFRDPWTNIDFYHELKLSSRSDRRHRLLEKKVLSSADAVMTVGPTMADEFKKAGCKKVYTITNGYDETEQDLAIKPVTGFSILHVGSMPSARNPDTFWKVLSEIAASDPQFKSDLVIHLIGNIDYTVLKSINDHEFEGNIIKQPQIPHHEVFSYLKQASVLLLVINNSPNADSILTNKLYEYLSAGRPILAIGPLNGDAAVILKQTGAGKIFDYNNRDDIYNYLLELYRKFKSGTLQVDVRDISQYSRRNITSVLAELLDSIIK